MSHWPYSSRSSIARRRLLLAGLAGSTVGWSLAGPRPAAAAAVGEAPENAPDAPEQDDGMTDGYDTSDGARPRQTDYERLRASWRGMVLGEGVDPNDARFGAAIERIDAETAEALALLRRGADRARVFEDLDLADEAAIGETFQRLRGFAIAWATPGSAYAEDAGLLDDTVAGLRTTYELAYHENVTQFGNWWHWEIGVPRNLTDTLVVLDGQVPAADLDAYLATIDHFVPDPFFMMPGDRRQESTGANRVDLCRAVCVRGVLGANDERIGRSRDGLSDIFAYVRTGDGFYPDGSFVQHGTVPYTGTYGVELLDGMAKLIALLADSPWAVDDPAREVLFRAVEITFVPVIYDNQMMDLVRGRAVSRELRQDHQDGRAATEHLLRLADGVQPEDPSRAARWRGIGKGWLTRDVSDGPYDEASVARVAAFARVLDDDAIPATSEPSGLVLFPGMDRAVHRGAGWAYGIAMSSSRISYYECGNGENDTGFHTGEGMTYLYLAEDNAQFSDGFWPTVDPYRMPGTTVDTAPLPDRAGGEWGEARPRHSTWVGGVRLAADDSTVGAVGAIGMELEGILAPLTARKSWFCLPNLVLALGAGICDSSGAAVETVVENRNLHADGEARLLLDGREQSSEQGYEHHGPVRWAHLEGVAGYVFAPGTRLSVRREERTGAYRDINDSGATEPITRRWLTMWLAHGVDPVDARYGYLVLPGADRVTTEWVARSGDVRVLANTPHAQAIEARSNGVVAVNFWQPGRCADIAVNAPCSVLLRRDGRDRLAFAVSDPTQLGTKIDVRLAYPGFRHWQADDTIEVTTIRPTIRLRVDTENSYGASHLVTFRR